MDLEKANRLKLMREKVRLALANKTQRAALKLATDRFLKARSEVLAGLPDSHELMVDARAIKAKAVEESVPLVERFSSNARSRGATVFFAKDAAEACDYVAGLAREKSVRLVVKSKSSTSEEIELNERLEHESVTVVETDMGERIVQLAKEKSSHFLAPAIHKDRFQVAELFSQSLGVNVEPDIAKIAAAARSNLREAFLSAEMGITGANVAVAEDGTFFIIENEGNARLVATLPRIHVAIMGIEKIVPTLSDALTMLRLIPKSATGQEISSYVSHVAGSIGSLDPQDQERELHIVILDNGRSRMKEHPSFREALYCIRCSACLNTCPTFKVVGGHVFGHIYAGPIGIPWTSFVHGREPAAEIAPLCISCGLCKTVCPVDIDIPMLIAAVKEDDNELHGQSASERRLMDYESFVKLGSQTAPLSNWLLRRRLFRLLLEYASGIDRRRRFPKFSREIFMSWFKGHNSKGTRKVGYFVDTYANYNEPEVGKATVQVLERNDCEVQVPTQKGSGMPHVLYGDLKGARKVAQFNVNSFAPLVKNGFDIVASEPTAAYCLKEIYPKLLQTSDARLVSEHAYELFGFLDKLRIENVFSADFARKLMGHVGYHIPCHSRPLSSRKPVLEFLRLMGLQVDFFDHGCCGMAGTYGFRKGLDGYEVSVAVGEPLFNEFRSEEIEFGVTESSVCKIHIEQGAGKPVVHPVLLLRDAYQVQATDS